MMYVSRGANLTLIKYQNLLLKWNKAINLISKLSEGDLWQRHIVDSLQLCKYLDTTDKIIDIGSGGGFPGIVLSICGIKDVTLIECDERKSIFLSEAAKLSSNKIKIIRTRVNLDFIDNCDVLTCRGCSSVVNILNMVTGIKIRKKILLLKGESYKKEISEAQKRWLFDVEIHDSITSDQGKVLIISNISKKND